MNKKSRKYSIAISGILFLFLFASFSAFSNNASKQAPLQKIRLQLKYYHQFQFAGYYAAVQKGFYKEEGLDVELLEGGAINSIDLVLNGEAEYGIAANDILIARLNHKPIVLLAYIFQSSPSIFLSLKASNINTAQDMIHKKVMLLDEYRDPELLAIFYQEGIKLKDINRVRTTYDIQDLIDGTTDVLNAYSTNEPYYLQEHHIDYSVIRPQSYGINFYGDGIFTSESEIKKHPKRAEAFLRASKKGWEYAMQNTEEILDILEKDYGVNKTRAHLRFEAKEIKKLIINDYVEIGHINPGRVDHIAQICSKMGMVPTNYNLDGFIYQHESFKTPPWLKWLIFSITVISLIIIIISLYLFLFNRQLRVAVDKQTKSLSEKNKELEREISERVKTVIALQASEKKFREMIENLPSGAVLVENKQIFTNKKALEITGYTNSELPDIDTWFIRLYQNRRNENYKIYKENKEDNFKYPVTNTIICKSGEEKQVEFHAYKFDNKEIWLLNDITERVKIQQELIDSETKLSTFIEESPNGIVMFTGDTKVVYTNPAFNSLMKINSDQKQNLRIPDFFTPSQYQENKTLWERLLETGKSQGEVLVKNTNKKNIPVYISALKLISNEYLAFVIDISNLKNVEKELIIALEKAEESDRLKSAFLANMSHEIRTPMNGILGFSQLLLRDDLTKEKKERYVDILNQNGKQLLDIINNIIDISYLEVKQLRLLKSEISIKKLIADLDALFQLEKKKYHKSDLKISFHNELSEDQDLITTDAGKLKQVLINLINNALKFTTEGYIRISVKLEQSKLSFKVEDSGIGIPLAKQKFIFKRFAQVENIYTRQFGGAGLGLPISKGIIELLNGEIFFESKEDEGTTFKFYIPISKIAKQNKTKDYPTPNNYQWNNKKILLVEDMDTNITFFKELLRDTNAELSICYNGLEAVNICNTDYRPDIILMDIQMPEMNGIQASIEIRKHLTSTPIIAQTAYASEEDKEMALKAGCNDYFSKPLDADRLLQRMNELLLDRDSNKY
ncbi:ABC transporter substrate-binding protein [Ancylomarina longa]|uniref:histidine kinase n=1 Tax=Ancylomarina longa TaxID=2487017 RepID=A0A434AZR4_9BACT|nr:ABC transporter substrate-binding protein [Ancylomarina longa]RUT80111.1 response regulator [Ancylomarina longa]